MKYLVSVTMQRLVALALLLAVLAACGSSAPTQSQSNNATNPTADPRAGWPQEFTIGFFGGDDVNDVLERNEPIRALLEKELGMPVKMFTGTSYSAVIEAMRAKRVDAMEVGPFSYILAVDEASAEALVASVSSPAKPAVYDASFSPHYLSVIFAKKGSGVTTLEDLKGKDFNFVDAASTSGHLAPKAYLRKHGIDPDKDMKTVFAGSHPSSVLAVWNDKSPAGATFEGNLLKLVNEGQAEACFWPDGQINKQRSAEEIKQVYEACPEGKLAMIGMTDPIPSTPFAVRQDLPESFKSEVKRTLLSIKDHPEIIQVTTRWYVDPSQSLGLARLDHYYNPLREVAKILDLNLSEMK